MKSFDLFFRQRFNSGRSSITLSATLAPIDDIFLKPEMFYSKGKYLPIRDTKTFHAPVHRQGVGHMTIVEPESGRARL